MLSVFKSKESIQPIKPFSINNLFLTFQTFIPVTMFYFIKKLNHVLQESNKLNFATEINTIINF